MKMKLLAAAAAGVLALTFGTAASATTTFTLSTGNAAISGYPPPYGTVNVNLVDSTHATIDFLSAVAGGYYFTSAQVADVNVNATSWTVSGLTGNGGALTNGGSNNADGFGLFNQTFDQFDGFSSKSSTISFTLTNTSGSWLTDAAVLTPNASGNSVAAHIGVCADAGCTSFVSTGFATGGGGPIPEPATWAMMILGFGGVGAMLRRRRVPQLSIA
jgi:hypothetical protein